MEDVDWRCWAIAWVVYLGLGEDFSREVAGTWRPADFEEIDGLEVVPVMLSSLAGR